MRVWATVVNGGQAPVELLFKMGPMGVMRVGDAIGVEMAIGMRLAGGASQLGYRYDTAHGSQDPVGGFRTCMLYLQQ